MNLMKAMRDFSDCSVYCFIETWLDPLTPDSAVLHSGYTVHRADGSPELQANRKVEECVRSMMNQRWCNDSSVLSTTCWTVRRWALASGGRWRVVGAGEWWALASGLTSCPVWLVRCVAVLTKPSRLIYISTGWCDTVG